MTEDLGHSYGDLEEWLEELRRRRDAGHEILWADQPKTKRINGVFTERARFGFVDVTDDTWHTILLMDARRTTLKNPEIQKLFLTREARDALLQPGG